MIEKLKVVLDTSFLIDVVKFKIDLWKELDRLLEHSYDTFIITNVEKELEKIGGSGNKFANAAMKIIKLGKIKRLDLNHKGSGDEAIIKLCDDVNVVVATNDIKLRQRVKSKGVKTIYIRSKKHLAIA